MATFNQPFDSATGFTKADTTEFTGGQMQQAESIPAAATAAANYETDEDLHYGNGTLTATLTGDAHRVADFNHMDLGLSGAVDYDATSKLVSSQGTVKAKFRFPETGAPSNVQRLYTIRSTIGSNIDRLELSLETDGQIYLYARAGLNVTHNSSLVGDLSPTAGQEYEIALSWYHRPETGTTGFWVHVDGNNMTNSPLAQDASGSRTAALDTFQMGRQGTSSTGSQYTFTDLVMYDTIQYRDNYTPGYTLGNDVYSEDLVTLPAFTAVGSLEGYNSFVTTEAGSPTYNIDGQYHDGAAWVASDGTAGQMNTAADINTNIGTLGNTDSVVVQCLLPASASTQSSVADLTIDYDSSTEVTLGTPYNLYTTLTEVDGTTAREGVRVTAKSTGEISDEDVISIGGSISSSLSTAAGYVELSLLPGEYEIFINNESQGNVTMPSANTNLNTLL